MITLLNLLPDGKRIGQVVTLSKIVPPGTTRVGLSLHRKGWTALLDAKADVVSAYVDISEDGVKWLFLDGFTSSPGQRYDRLGNPSNFTTSMARLPRDLIGNRVWVRARISYLTQCGGKVDLVLDDNPVPPKPVSEHKSVEYDNDSDTTGTNITSKTFSLAIANNSNRYLVVTGTAYDTVLARVTPSSITFNTTNNLGSVYDYIWDSYANNYIWGVANPDATTANVVVTMGGAVDEFAACAISLYNVDQTTSTGTPAGANGTNNASTVNVGAAVGDMVVDTVYCYNDWSDLPDPGAGQTARARAQITTLVVWGSSTEAGNTTVTMSWTQYDANDWGISAVAIKAAAAAGGWAGEFCGVAVSEFDGITPAEIDGV